jgi:hypothetical protein
LFAGLVALFAGLVALFAVLVALVGHTVPLLAVLVPPVGHAVAPITFFVAGVAVVRFTLTNGKRCRRRHEFSILRCGRDCPFSRSRTELIRRRVAVAEPPA